MLCDVMLRIYRIALAMDTTVPLRSLSLFSHLLDHALDLVGGLCGALGRLVGG